ncbi:hypothetical protein [Clostridium perfringens]|nr:hypothetical protein [Clostridium perfringens]MEA5268661.1 hypothetical protein [Clostridium perfringens]MEA5380416.1 hypothetical protein [Clostridium perfringens]
MNENKTLGLITCIVSTGLLVFDNKYSKLLLYIIIITLVFIECVLKDGE